MSDSCENCVCKCVKCLIFRILSRMAHFLLSRTWIEAGQNMAIFRHTRRNITVEKAILCPVRIHVCPIMGILRPTRYQQKIPCYVSVALSHNITRFGPNKSCGWHGGKWRNQFLGDLWGLASPQIKTFLGSKGTCMDYFWFHLCVYCNHLIWHLRDEHFV